MILYLVPSRFRSTIHIIRNVCLYMEIGTVVLLLLMALLGAFKDFIAAITFSASILCITTPLLIPGLLYYKVSQSYIELSSDEIQVKDMCGNVWRSIPYDMIADIRVKSITGFFYGKNKYHEKDMYICFFLNENRDIPTVSYVKYFTSKNFFMVHYKYETYQSVLHALQLNSSQYTVDDIDG